jgi:hypothetical protein
VGVGVKPYPPLIHSLWKTQKSNGANAFFISSDFSLSMNMH